MTDYIKREDALKCLKEASEQIDWGQSDDGDAFKHYVGAVYRTIASKKHIPSADAVERKRGEWIDEESWSDCNVYKCSVCGEPWELNYGTPQENNMNFCPNCGADMREREGE